LTWIDVTVFDKMATPSFNDDESSLEADFLQAIRSLNLGHYFNIYVPSANPQIVTQDRKVLE
jgi:hypothetical protein